ncbi:hydrolase [Loigolactobacillus bifermentans]|uniref:Hydrolase n=1 Tax=Loigolactobacillus bifermentans DSM 20003 TaxID=1423726 RepID=A0A0R1GHC8_9LACO|nr:hydrolase [Loigolactobacillus bifermentans]KRK33416.1 hypothetical protein FC07_GL001177 [Loigolactobacillus bifermentans DSM 20003]QGG61408.1 hydrolase [Loigolactobacillus bifermentans]
MVPEVTTALRQNLVKVPEVIKQASGIIILGKKIRSIVFSTDIALIRNINADAVLAVYPFTPHPAIMQAISMSADIPILAGIGGGLTHGERSMNMSLFAESLGSLSVVLNAPTPVATIQRVEEVIDIPIILTVVSAKTDLAPYLAAGVDIVNISGAAATVEIVKSVRQRYPELPIIATGGPTDATIAAAIAAGANAISYTPPSNGALFKAKMAHYREDANKEID